MRASFRKSMLSIEQLEDRCTPTVGFALLANNQLARFDTTASPTAATPIAITGIGSGEVLAGIDIRPQNGLLYGLSSNGAGAVRLYTINPQSGVAAPLTSNVVNFTNAAGALVPITGTKLEIDFNPAADLLRVVTNSGFNFRINPNTGALVDNDNNAATGINPDAAINGPSVTGLDGTAYTNSVANSSITTQYTIDLATNSLYIQNPSNGGTQTNPIALNPSGGLTIQSINGFDIQGTVATQTSNSPVVVGLGYIFINGQSASGSGPVPVAGVASVNLVTGEIGPITALTGLTNVIGIAVRTAMPLQPIALVPRSGNAAITIVDPVSGNQFIVPNPLAGFAGPVDVAVGDVNADGTADLIVAAGRGGGPRVVVIDGATGAKVADFFAFDINFTGGVNLAVGDINSDGRADIIVGAGFGGGPNVRAFDGGTLAVIIDVLVYQNNFTGGVSVAVGDVDGDGRGDIITGAGVGGGPHVKVFETLNLAYIRDFFVYNLAFTGGINVAAGDVTNDGIVDIITGAGPGGGPHVRVFRGSDLFVAGDFFAYDFNFTGGVYVGAGAVPGHGRLAVLTAPGVGGGPLVRAFDPVTGEVLFNQFLADANVAIGASVS